MRNERIATIRTTVNSTVLLYITIFLNWVFDWNISLDDLAPFAPVILAVVAIFYRLSLWLNEKFPTLGWILFGYKTPPSY